MALFTEKGFHTTSISGIVERAGLTRDALYSHYRDKEELFPALYDARTGRLLARLEDAAVGLDPEQGPWRSSWTASGSTRRSSAGSGSRWSSHCTRRAPLTARALAAHEEHLPQSLSHLDTRALTGVGRPAQCPQKT
ncbi:TetR/AcrR family transcriptional regulator [Streptomyces ochraceiscleroticus]|uniref:TetR/AcrR family transcriptional regulator n=1 Tax=Streptomyces ochraceiscleroticus TaxID=47761 RepID=A0ABW1MJN0_9ACTN